MLQRDVRGVGRGGWDLVAAAQRGDRDAYAGLYQRYAGAVYRLVLSRTGDHPLAQDLTAETFTRGLRDIDSVSDQGRDVIAWFTTIARNLLIDHRKAARYRREHTTGEVPEGAVTTWAAPTPGPEQVVLDRETRARLWRCVARLTPEQRRCLALRFGYELSTAQTAAVMGRSEEAVKGLRHRALGALRVMLTDRATEAAAYRDRGHQR